MRFPVIIATILALAIPLPAFAQKQQERSAETNFTITVKARDAKFVGTAMGGAQVIIRDRRSGDILVQGRTLGGTGDTQKIMDGALKRDAVIVDDNTAKFQFSMELFEPLPVTITATGPLDQPQATASVSEDTVLIPGKDYTHGNGIMMELPGFAVDILDPPANASVKLAPDKPVPVSVNVLKMCGCHIVPDSPWPPERYEVEVRIYKDDIFITSAALEYRGKPGLYGQDIKIPLPGTYRLVVTAFDKATKEAGMDATGFTLTQ